MKKSDLKDEMIVQTGEDLYLVCGDKFLSLNGYMEFKDYDENLKMKDEGFEKFNINFVYKTKSYGLGLEELLSETKSLEKIWERPREIDWSKVPFGTKVQASDHSALKESRRKSLVSYEKRLKKPFLIFSEELNEVFSYKYCRIHPSVKIKEEWYKE
ncbi:hypothetical protein JVI29_002907 [Clostridium perfringens]